MKKLTLEDLLGAAQCTAWQDDASETRRRAALAVLFASLPSQAREPGERRLQVENFARALSDVPPAVLEAVVVRLEATSDWMPRIREIREACARKIREVRWALTGSGEAGDYDPEHGVRLEVEAEIEWAASNHVALTAGVEPVVARVGLVIHDTPRNREALLLAQADGRLLGMRAPERYAPLVALGPGAADGE